MRTMRMTRRTRLFLMAFLSFLIACALLLFGLFPARADLIRQGAAYNRTVLMTSSTDHISPYTGAASTLAVQVAQAAGAFAGATLTTTALGNGRFNVALTATQTATLGALDLNVTAAGADPSDTHDQVVAFDPNDAALLGLTGVATAAAQATNVATLSANQATNVATLSANQTAILNRLGTPAGASVDADILTRSTYAGGAVASVTAPVSLSAGDETKIAFLDAAITSRLAASTYTAPAAFPSDYQQRGVAVTLPAAPTGYGGSGGGGDTPGVTTLLARIPGTVQPQTGDAYLAAGGVAASTVAAMKADALLAKTFLRPSGKYTYNMTTRVMTLLNDDGTTMGTVTLAYDAATGTITGKQ